MLIQKTIFSIKLSKRLIYKTNTINLNLELHIYIPDRQSVVLIVKIFQLEQLLYVLQFFKNILLNLIIQINSYFQYYLLCVLLL